MCRMYMHKSINSMTKISRPNGKRAEGWNGNDAIVHRVIPDIIKASEAKPKNGTG